MKRKVVGLSMGLILAGFLLPGILAGQCSLCRSALVDSPEGRRLAAGFNRGILFLASVPFLTVGAIGILVLQSRRKQASGQAVGETGRREEPRPQRAPEEGP